MLVILVSFAFGFGLALPLLRPVLFRLLNMAGRGELFLHHS